MVPIHTRARISDDGTLVLRTPPRYRGREVEVLVILPTIDANSDSMPENSEWPAGFFEQTQGKRQGEFERPASDDYETRDALP